MNRPQSKYVVGDGPDKELIEDLLAAADNADLNPKSLQQRLCQAADRLYELQSRPQQAATLLAPSPDAQAVAWLITGGNTSDGGELNEWEICAEQGLCERINEAHAESVRIPLFTHSLDQPTGSNYPESPVSSFSMKKVATMAALLRIVAYPRRGTNEESMDIYAIADVIQKKFTSEEFEEIGESALAHPPQAHDAVLTDDIFDTARDAFHDMHDGDNFDDSLRHAIEAALACAGATAEPR